MNVEETIKHLGNHWDLYSLAGEGEYSFDKAKKYLMDECGKPESTARAKMSAFRYAGDSLLKISSDGRRYSIDPKKVNEQELMFARISDRILDMCRPIHMETVESKRVASGKHKHEILKEIFGKEEPSNGND